jgi:hypothetical protein
MAMKKLAGLSVAYPLAPAALAPKRRLLAGALAGIVERGRTGFLVRDTGEKARAIREARGIDPEDCRRAARELEAIGGRAS